MNFLLLSVGTWLLYNIGCATLISNGLNPQRTLASLEVHMCIIDQSGTEANIGYDEIIMLCPQGVDLNVCDYDGRTALHLASTTGSVPRVRCVPRVPCVYCVPCVYHVYHVYHL